MAAAKTISFYSESTVPTAFGRLRVRVYRDCCGAEPLAILGSRPVASENEAVRIHSSCLTSESLGSLRCDCREQLNFALQYIADHGGVIIYLHQEGRGIGLGEKLRAYELQDRGYDTVEANEMLGFPVDARDYQTAGLILRDLGIRSVRLLTNNPAKIAALNECGIPVLERIPVLIQPSPHSEQYLATKFTRMGHLRHQAAGHHGSKPDLADSSYRIAALRRTLNSSSNPAE